MKEEQRQAWISLLTVMFDREIEKNENEIDYDFIEFCAVKLEELTQEKIDITDEELRRRCAEITGVQPQLQSVSIPKKKRHYNHRMILITAITSSLIGAVMTAYAETPQSTKLMLEASNTPVNTVIHEGDYSARHLSTPRSYDSLDAFLQEEQKAGCFPLGIDISHITRFSDSEFAVDIADSNAYIMLSYDYSYDTTEMAQHYESFDTEIGMTYYLNCCENAQAYAIHDFCYYYIFAESKEELLSIIQSMEEITT